MRARVFVAFTPSTVRMLWTTKSPMESNDSASTFAIRSYSPKSGYSSTIRGSLISFS